MKSFVILLASIAINTFGQSQCPGFQLADLQGLQRADADLKESKIQDLGFDLRSEFAFQGAKTRGYSKCWNATIRQKAVYEQLIWWNTEQNSITFFTLNQDQFTALRQSIVERRASGNVTENPDVYVGHLFVYRFGAQRVDGVEYFVISIASKG